MTTDYSEWEGKGQLQRADINYTLKHPLILHRKANIINLLTRHLHPNCSARWTQHSPRTARQHSPCHRSQTSGSRNLQDMCCLSEGLCQDGEPSYGTSSTFSSHSNTSLHAYRSRLHWTTDLEARKPPSSKPISACLSVCPPKPFT